MTLIYKETVEVNAPSTAGFSPDGGRAVSTYLLDSANPGPVTATILADTVTELLGTTEYALGTGGLKRTPPKAHPMFPWLYASSISSIRGIGEFTTVDNTAPGAPAIALDVPTLDKYALYDQYLLTVEFLPRMYPIVVDDNIQQLGFQWYPETGGGTTVKPFIYYPEWQRYLDVNVQTQNDNITGQQGTMAFESTTVGIDLHTLQSGARMYLPNEIITYTWFGVPYRYMTSSKSYINRWRGRINQNSFLGPGGQVFGVGSLLYLSASPMKYTPSVPKLVTGENGTDIFSSDKLCNIVFTFLATYRTATDLKPANANKNYVQGGHTLLPYLPDRKFHYAVSSTADKTPAFLSYPMELLFTDPDLAQPSVF